MLENFSILFAFGAMVFWGIGDFLVQKSVRRIGNFQTLIWINLFAGLSLFPFVIKSLGSISGQNFFILSLLTFFDLLYGIVLFKAYEKGKLSIVDVVLIIELPLTILLGILFLSESISAIELFLILIIFIGSFLVTKKHETVWNKIKEFLGRKSSVLEKGVLLALFASFIGSFSSLFIAVNSRQVSPIVAIWFPWMASLLFLIPYLVLKNKVSFFWGESKKVKNLIFWTAFISVAGWVSYSLALEENKLSITTAITEGYAVISVFLGIRINKEKISALQYSGAFIAIAGSITLGLINIK